MVDDNVAVNRNEKHAEMEKERVMKYIKDLIDLFVFFKQKTAYEIHR